jgi:hypothetical protein
VVARIGGRVVQSVGWESQARSSVKGFVRAKLLQIGNELEDSNGRYAARIMRYTCSSLGIFFVDASRSPFWRSSRLFQATK